MSCRACSLGFTFWAAFALALSAPTPAAEPDAALQANVKRLMEQLADKDPARQTAAEAALLKLGPDILPLLPESSPNKRLKTIRRTLRDARIRQGLAPQTFTLQDRAMPLSKTLKALAGQTAVPVADRRQNKEVDPKLRLNLNRVTFWQGLDAIAREADLRVDLYQPDGTIALVDGPHRELPVSYHGLFRVVVKGVELVRDFETEAHLCRARLEIAWEPRFQPLFLQARPEALEIKDDRGIALKSTAGASGRTSVGRGHVVETQVLMEAPPRAVKAIGLLRGTIGMVGPSSTLTFTFDKLAGKERQSKDGVTVTLREFDTQPERWTVRFLLQYPPDDPDFDSFESWLVTSQIHLVKKGTRKGFGPGSYESDTRPGHRATFTYDFVEENGLVLGKPADWKLVYQLPGPIIELPVKFEFKDLPLP
ncbi:MAG TPA: hypothetical protein VG013_15300 [Gemmataceae bacterium]|nr:hypothetical protein [Gemmataceae bacterium]